MEAHQPAIIKIPKQSDLAGSSRDQVQNRTHARIQALRLCCHHHCRNRTTTSYSQRPIRPRILTPQRPSCPRYLERCPRCIDQSFSKTSSCPTEIICTRAVLARHHRRSRRERCRAVGALEMRAKKEGRPEGRPNVALKQLEENLAGEDHIAN